MRRLYFDRQTDARPSPRVATEQPYLNPIERALAAMVRHAVEQDRAAEAQRSKLRVVKGGKGGRTA